MTYGTNIGGEKGLARRDREKAQLNTELDASNTVRYGCKDSCKHPQLSPSQAVSYS